MKKTFSLLIAVFVLVGLVTLVGCNGLWNFSDDDSYVPPASVTLSSSVVVPAGAAPSIRGAAVPANIGALTATLYSRIASSTPIASTSVDATTGRFSITQTLTAGDYFIKITNATGTFVLLNYVTVTSPSVSPTMTDTGSASTAIGYLIQDADKKSRIVKVTDFSVTDTAVVTFAATIETFLKDANRTATSTPTIPVINVDSVTLNKTTTSIVVGETETLTATVAPAYADNTDVAWATSNSAVATVGSLTGKITAVATGTADITVKTTDGGFVATCTVTVTAAPVAPKDPVTNVTLSAEIPVNTPFTDIQINITGVTSTYDTTTTLKNTAGADVAYAKSSTLSDAAGNLVLAATGIQLTPAAAFSTLTFTTAIPAGATVTVKKSDGTVLATYTN